MRSLRSQSHDAGLRLLRDVWALCAISLMVVILRVIAKIRIRKFGFDDAFMALAMVSD